MEVAPFFVDFHHFLSIFTIYALLSRFTFCRDLRTFSANFFGQNSHLRNITRFLHVCSRRSWQISGMVEQSRCKQILSKSSSKMKKLSRIVSENLSCKQARRLLLWSPPQPGWNQVELIESLQITRWPPGPTLRRGLMKMEIQHHCQFKPLVTITDRHFWYLFTLSKTTVVQ